jgi:hypothetical protein
MDYIETHLPSGLKPMFYKFKRSNYSTKSLKPREKNIIFAVLRQILKNYDYEV